MSFFMDQSQKNRRLVAIDSTDLFTDVQKFCFSTDGKLLAVGSKDGSRITVMELQTTDDTGALALELTIVAVCYRGFFSCHFKTMEFSPDNELLMISSDTATIHAFHIGPYLRAKHNLAFVRKNELLSCVHFKVPEMLKNDPSIVNILGKERVK